MATKKEIASLNKVMKNLNNAINQIENRTMKGLINASIIIRRDMDKTPPLIPIDTGNLRQSWFWTRTGTKKKPALIIGFSANYAVFVHEMVGADFTSPRKRYRPGAKARGPRGGKYIEYVPRQGAGPKFFEASLNRNHQEILNAIRNEVRLK